MVLLDFRTVRFLAACACSRRRYQICRLRGQGWWLLFVRRELLTWTATTFAGTVGFLLLLLLLVWRWHCSSTLRLKFVAQKLITNVIAAIAATVPADSSIESIIVVIVFQMAMIPFFVLHRNRWWCWRRTEDKFAVATLSQWWTLLSMLRSWWKMRFTDLIVWKNPEKC